MQTDTNAFLEAFVPLWYAEIADEIELEEFQLFIEERKDEILGIFDAWLAGELGEDDEAEDEADELPAAAAPPAPPPTPRTPAIPEDTVDPVEAWTQGQRTRANLEAMQLVHDKPLADMTSADRVKLAAYSGWGGLSIDKNRARFPPGMEPEDFGLIHEYYTPKRVADAMAQAVCPLLPTLGVGGKVRALEPSAGIGRLIRSMSALQCGVEIEWVAVEFSRISARMLGALRPDITLHRGTFESWVHEHGPKFQGGFNLVIANPPYGERGAAASEDPTPGYREAQSYAYFMRRSMDLLAPGGLGVYLIPAGFLSGARNEELRRKILLRNHLVTAYRLPSMEGKRTLFPGANLVVDCVFLRSRGGMLAEIDASDRAILEGRYFGEYPAHILGREAGRNSGEDDQVRGGAGRYRYTVEGAFTGLPPIVARPICEACILRPPEPPRRAAKSSGPVRRVDVDLAGLDPAVASAVLLGLRVDTFLSAYAAGNAEIAAGLWGELHDALEQLRTSPLLAPVGGNPWRSDVIRQQADARVVGAERLLAAFDRATGELIPPLRTQPVFERRYEGRVDDIVAQAEWLYRSRRVITLADMTAFHISVGGGLPQPEIRKTLLHARWCLDGDLWIELVPEPDYYTGDLWPKYDRAKLHEAADPQAAEQARRLLGVIGPAVFEDIESISARSAWVPMTLREGWISEVNGRYGPVTLKDIGGTVIPAGLDKYDDLEFAPALSEEALWILGWINHDRTTFSPRSAKTDKDESVDNARLRLASGWDASFREWLGKDPERRATLTEAYNRRFRGFVQPTYSAEPLEVARWAPDGPRPHPWQIAGARRVLDNHGGLVAFDVGVGKTFTACLIVAAGRQEGWVRRPVIVVPTSLAWKWYDDLRRVLPDFRIGVAGQRRKTLTRGPRVQRAAARLVAGEITEADYKRMITTSEPDSPEERAATWTMLQAGQLDVVIVTYDALPRTRVNLDALVAYVDRKAAVQRILTLKRRNAAKRKAGKDAEDEGTEAEGDEDAAEAAAEIRELSERQEAILKHSTAGWVSERLALREGMQYDPGIAWDDIGIDLLVVDEAASFKNLYMPEPREFGVPKFMGNPGEGSDRAWQLDFRAAMVRQRTGGSGIVLLSATPAKNSPLEFFNLIQFIDDAAFARLGIDNPEQFIDRYLKIEPRQVIDASMSATTESAVVGFHNLDELRGIIFRYGEFRTAEEVGIELPKPMIQKPEVEMDPAQEAKYDALVTEIEQSIEDKDTSDILGKLARLSLIAVHADMDEGYSWQTALQGGEQLRKIPLTSVTNWTERGWTVVSVKHKKPEDKQGKSMATIRRTLPRPSYSSPKFRAVAERVAMTPSCGHIIFCENVAAHLWLVEVLVAHGIPRERIAMLNAKATKSPQDRLSVARGFNGDPRADLRPIYDVVIANNVAQEGVDLQTRTCAIHHVDLPWTPADLEQRNGRAYRQGNQLSTIAIYYYFAQRSMDGFRFNQIDGKATWLADLIKSSKRETNNPGAQQELSPEETLLMISRNKERTQALLEEVKAKKEQERRELEAKNAAKILARANARFRDARADDDPIAAARLRGEGEALLADLQRVSPESWPWAPWIGRVRDVEFMIPVEGEAPVFEGLRVGKANAIYTDRVDYFEFGRLHSSNLIGLRGAGAETWSLKTLEEVVDLDITPDALHRGATSWPEGEAQRTEQAIMTHLSRLSASGLCTWARLGWRGASDAWIEAWWPKVHHLFIQGLLRAYHNEEVYPIVIGGVLHLETRERLGEGELLPPTAAGFRQLISLAPPTRLVFSDLDEVAQTWWFRPFPRGYLTEARQAAAAAAAEREAAAQALAPAPLTVEPAAAAGPDEPALTRPRQEPAVAARPAEPALTRPRQAPAATVRPTDPTAAGQVLTDDRQDPPPPAARVPVGPGAGFTLDSTEDEVLAALQAVDPAAYAIAKRGAWDRLEDHSGPLSEQAHTWARFHRQLPAQRRRAEHLDVEASIRGLALEPELERAFLDQLTAAYKSGGDMRAVLADATARKAADEQARTQPPLAPALAPVPAGAGLLHFTVERQEIARALVTARTVLEDTQGGLGKIQVACDGTVILRLGTAGSDPSQSFFELRLLTTRCIRAGAVTVQGRALQDGLRGFGDGAIEVMKAEGHNLLKLRQRSLETNLPTVDYVPIDPAIADMDPAGVITLDDLWTLLGSVQYVVNAAATKAEHLTMAHFAFEEGRLSLVATDGHQLVRAVRELPGGEALDGLHLAGKDIGRLRQLLHAYQRHLHPRDDRSPVRLRLAARPGHYLSGESDALRFVVSHDPRAFPQYGNALPKKAPEALLVGHSELRAHLQAARRLFDDEETLPRVALQVCEGDVRLRAEHPATGKRLDVRLRDGKLFGRPFFRSFNPSYMLDALDHVVTTSTIVIACSTEALTPFVVLRWPPHGPAPTRSKVHDHVARELKSGTMALIGPMRPEEGEDHGCAD